MSTSIYTKINKTRTYERGHYHRETVLFISFNKISINQGSQVPQKFTSQKSFKNHPLKNRNEPLNHQKWLPYKL